MRLAEKIAALPPLDVGGPIAANRFDYQKNWTLCELMELYSSCDDFVVICDYHEDVSILDSTTNPSEIKFYQVKTKNKGTWSVKKLVDRPIKSASQGHSYVARLTHMKDSLPGENVKLFFVTNTEFSFFPQDRRVAGSTMRFDELSMQHKDELLQALSKELGRKVLVSDYHLVFNTAQLPLEQHEDNTIGKLTQFLHETFPTIVFDIIPLKRTLFDEIRRKTNCERVTSDFFALVSSKGITKISFSSMLNSARVSGNPDSLWQEIASQLNCEGISFPELKELRAQWKVHEIQRLEPTNTIHRKMHDEIRNTLSKIKEKTLREIVKKVTREIKKRGEYTQYTADYIKVAVLWEVYENDGQVQDVDSQSEEKTT